MQVLAAVASAKGLTRAAAELHMTPSAISKRIAELELRFGTALLVRNSTGVELTPAGEIVARSCDDIMVRVAEMTNEIGALLARQQGEIKVMANTTAILLGLFEDVDNFRRQHGAVRVQVSEGASVEVADAVKSNEVDVGVAVRNARMNGLQLNPYRHTGLSVVMNKGHPLEALPRITNQDLRGHEIIWSPPADLVEGIRAKDNPSRDVRLKVRTFNGVVRSVQQGVGIAIVPDVAVPDPLPSGVVKAPLHIQGHPFEVVICHDASVHANPVKHQFIAWLAAQRNQGKKSRR
jgi:DNA-binding transcriptional LysR family regulator